MRIGQIALFCDLLAPVAGVAYAAFAFHRTGGHAAGTDILAGALPVVAGLFGVGTLLGIIGAIAGRPRIVSVVATLAGFIGLGLIVLAYQSGAKG
jgi:hypothetical protein